jgi:ATP-dependent RNA helicase RhlE
MAFSELGLGEILLHTLREQHYHCPTPIQIAAIPAILSERDVLAAAQTGSGKTAAFVLPILQLLLPGQRSSAKSVRALILAPTRELAAQVADSVQTYARHSSLRSTAVFGGVRIEPQIAQLQEGVDVLIATPGRLLDLYQQQAMQFAELEILVLDEADRMLDLGFVDDIRRIQSLLPTSHQTLLFSATYSDEIKILAKSLLRDPLVLEVSKNNSAVDTVEQTLYPVAKDRKPALLIHMLKRHKWPQALVFCATKHGADALVKQLEQAGFSAAAIHANRSQQARSEILGAFKQGSLAVLVATDLAARGIDVPQLPCVINVDLPYVAEDYVHRIGRTGRIGKPGLAISLYSDDQSKQLAAIERFIGRKFLHENIVGFAPKTNVIVKVLVDEEDEYGNFEAHPVPARRDSIKGGRHVPAKSSKGRHR